jgi:hypothetical protein
MSVQLSDPVFTVGESFAVAWIAQEPPAPSPPVSGPGSRPVNDYGVSAGPVRPVSTWSHNLAYQWVSGSRLPSVSLCAGAKDAAFAPPPYRRKDDHETPATTSSPAG